MEEYQLFIDPQIIGILKKQALHVQFTPAEQELVEIWMHASKTNKEIVDRLHDPIQLAKDLSRFDNTNIELSVCRFKKNVEKHKRPVTYRRWALPAAAVILLVATLSMLLLQYDNSSVSQKETIATIIDQKFPPGGNKATLTLSNGKTISLDESRDELILSDSALNYKDGTTLTAIENITTATLTIPRGGQYRVVLSDGTRVFLNAESTLEYPTRFLAGERKVTLLRGEAYFDVMHNPKKPFRVQTPRQQISVLGTRFNVRTYEETEKTTLVSGKVAIRNTNSEQLSLLNPGQLAQVGSSTIQIRHVDPEEYIGWVDSKIIINEASLIDVISELQRWYDVNFILPTDYAARGKSYILIDRKLKLSSILESLELTYNVSFKLRGKEVYVQTK